MKLGDLIQEYRHRKKLSQRQFATRCFLSNGYIAMLERGGINPKTNQPITPTLVAMKKLADGMDISLSELLSKVDDMHVSLSADDNFALVDSGLSSAEQHIIETYRNLNDEGKSLLISYTDYLIDKYSLAASKIYSLAAEEKISSEPIIEDDIKYT